MRKGWQLYAQHILDTVEKLYRIRDRGDIEKDEILYDATLRNLQTLSEATQKLPENLKNLHPEIPWQNISGFRNILVHNYLGEIDHATLANVVETQLQPLQIAVSQMLIENPIDLKES